MIQPTFPLELVGPEAGPVIVKLDRVTKEFDGAVALNDLSLDVHTGEFLTLLGPSGCGKTTTLRLINGFEVPTSGTVSIAGDVVNATPPFHRNVNTVFQNYALFPHLTVEANVSYGLVVARRPRAEITRRVGEILERVALTDKARRYPHELSGGQMQRVAVARALINEPKVLLLDEPLGALDARLRRKMHIELRRMHQELGITFICVTHDQEEALVMSDRIAVMKDGTISQIGSPKEVYERPQTSFVADFIGGYNFLSAHIQTDGSLTFSAGERLQSEVKDKRGPVQVAVRPSKLILAADGMGPFSAVVIHITYLGDTCRLILQSGRGESLVAESSPGLITRMGIAPESRVSFGFAIENMVILDPNDRTT